MNTFTVFTSPIGNITYRSVSLSHLIHLHHYSDAISQRIIRSQRPRHTMIIQMMLIHGSQNRSHHSVRSQISTHGSQSMLPATGGDDAPIFACFYGDMRPGRRQAIHILSLFAFSRTGKAGGHADRRTSGQAAERMGVRAGWRARWRASGRSDRPAVGCASGFAGVFARRADAG